MISVQNLLACGVSFAQAQQFADPLSAACDRFAITAVPHRAAFLAQAMHESTNFTRLEESTYYSTPERIQVTFKRLRAVPLERLGRCYIKNPQALANLAYANISGNGDESTGDGWKYRGRGLFQLTGRANYMAAGAALDRPYKEQPESVALPEDAALSAAWFWATIRLSALLDTAGIDVVSRRVNGGDNGLAERRELYARCLRALT